MDDWADLLLTGGFAPRDVLLRGLTIEQVGTHFPGVPHSIYQDLWHAASALRMSLNDGRVALERWPYEAHFPVASAPPTAKAWAQLVDAFLSDLHRAVRFATDPSWLASPEPGYPDSTWRDGMAFLAVHTAYHLGRIVVMRQLLGAWPPPNET